MLEIILQTILEEFGDIPDTAQLTRTTLRLVVAAFLGGILGYDREKMGKSAGLRTHMLVSLGSALFVLVPEQAGVSLTDLSRVLQGLIAGVGFLGAGSIIQGSKQSQVKGLTTAASVWLTAAIGMSAGMGRESTAILSTCLAMIILSVIPKIFVFIEDYEKPLSQNQKEK